jgi:hypothetical protein
VDLGNLGSVERVGCKWTGDVGGRRARVVPELGEAS